MHIKKLIAILIIVSGLVACEKIQSTEYKLSNETNSLWLKGVSREWTTAFFVKNSEQARIDFAIGKKVSFSDGSDRTVTRHRINGNDLIVFLDGHKLNGDLVGYPNSVKPHAP